MDTASYLHYRKRQKKPRGPRAVGRTLFVLGCLGAFFLGLIALDFYILFRPPRLKIILEGLLANHIEGHISFEKVSLNPLQGLKLRGINYTPKVKNSSLKSVTGDATLQLKLSALAQGQVELGRILLSQLRITIARDPEVGWSFAPITKQTENAPSSTPPTIPEIELENGSLVVRDHTILRPTEWVVLSGIGVHIEPQDRQTLALRGSFQDRTFGDVRLDSVLDTMRGFEELKLTAEGFFPTDSFRSKLTPKFSRYLETIGAKGSLNAELTIRPPHLDGESIPEDHDLDDRVTLRLRGNDLELTPPDFPYAFPNVEGSIVMNLSSIKLERLQAMREDGAIVVASGELRNYLEPDQLTGSLAVRTASLNVDSWLRRALPPAGQDAWDAFSPSGTLDLSVNVERTDPEVPWDVLANVDLRGMDLTYNGFFNEEAGRRFGFPYRLRSLTGTVNYESGKTKVKIDGVTNGGGTAEIEGTLEGDPSVMSVDLTVTAHNIPFDEDLRQALNREARFIYDRAKPRGHMSAEAIIKKAFGKDQRTLVTIHGDVQSASFEYELFPYPAEEATGKVVIAPGEFRIKKMECLSGDAEFVVDVDVLGSGTKTSERIEVHAKNVPMDATLERALRALPSPGLHQVLDDFQPTGMIDANFLHTRAVEAPRPELKLEGNIRDGSTTFVGFPVLLEGVEGEFRVETSDVYLKDFTATRKGAPVWFEGEILNGDDAGDSFLNFGGGPLEIDEELLAAVETSPTLPGETIVGLDPTGRVELDCKFVADLERQAFVAKRIEITPTNAGLSHTWIPGRLSDLSGSVIAEENRINFNGIKGKLLGGDVAADGGFVFDEELPPSLEFTLLADALHFEEGVEEPIDGEAGRLIERHRPRGKVSTDGLQIKIYPKPEDPTRTKVRLAGSLDLEDLEADFGIRVKDWSGRLNIDQADIGDKGYDFSLHAHENTARIFGYRFDNLSTRIEGIEDYIRFRNLRGNLYDGTIDTVRSSFQMHTSNPTDYQGSFRATGIELQKAFTDLGRAAETRGKADLDFTMHRGEGEGLNAIRGEGKFRIYDAQLFSVPFLTQLLTVVPVTDPPVFTRAAADFTIRDGGLDLDPVEVYSVPVSIRGQGFLSFGGELDFSLATRIVPDLPSIPIIDLPISLIGRSFFGIRVQGTVEDPVIRADNVLAKAFSSDKGQIRRLRPLPHRKKIWTDRY